MFGMYEHVFVAVTISRMKRWVVELTNHWFICWFWPLHESLPSNRQSEQQCDWGISGSYDRQSVTQRRPCLLNMSLWNWQTTFFRHRQRATIDCTSHLCVSSCEICLLSTTMSLSPHHRVQPPLVVLFTIVSFPLLSSSETSYCPNRFQTHSDVNAGCVCSRVSSRCRLLCEPTEREKAACCLRSSLHEERSVMKKASSVNTWNKYANMTSLKCV